MSVSLKSENLGTYFNIFEPDKMPGKDYALFIGSTEGNQFTDAILTEGDYIIQVYNIRSTARRSQTTNFSLNISRIMPSSTESSQTNKNLNNPKKTSTYIDKTQ
jgi:hypothetical protein